MADLKALIWQQAKHAVRPSESEPPAWGRIPSSLLQKALIPLFLFFLE